MDAITGTVLSTRTAKAEAAASKYVKAKVYSENYAEYEEKAKASLKSTYFTDDGEVKDELKTKYAAEFDAYTQEEKEKLSVADMTQEEYVVWRAISYTIKKLPNKQTLTRQVL